MYTVQYDELLQNWYNTTLEESPDNSHQARPAPVPHAATAGRQDMRMVIWPADLLPSAGGGVLRGTSAPISHVPDICPLRMAFCIREVKAPLLVGLHTREELLTERTGDLTWLNTAVLLHVA